MKNKDRFETYQQAYYAWYHSPIDGVTLSQWLFQEYIPTALDAMVEEYSAPTTRNPDDPMWVKIDYWGLSHLIEYGIVFPKYEFLSECWLTEDYIELDDRMWTWGKFADYAELRTGVKCQDLKSWYYVLKENRDAKKTND